MKPEPELAHAEGFKVPLELLKAFKSDIRFIPVVPHNNGYIIFDMEMLTSVLRRGDAKAGAALADQLDALGRSKAQLVIMANPSPEQIR